jgi:hypothetical protein
VRAFLGEAKRTSIFLHYSTLLAHSLKETRVVFFSLLMRTEAPISSTEPGEYFYMAKRWEDYSFLGTEAKPRGRWWLGEMFGREVTGEVHCPLDNEHCK